MDGRPPVPPKDGQYISRMELDHPSTAPGSGSKRKREPHESNTYNSNLDIADPDEHTPKRSRSSLRHGEASESEDATPAHGWSIRRKRGSRNLSNLNLRHAARKQASPLAQSRESKFQEGSLTDKPSQKPPSAFTRVMRTESGNLEQIDVLMSDYHDGMHTPPDSFEAAVEREKASLPARMAQFQAEAAADKEESKGFFQFGRNFASNFHPVTLWNKLWNDSKEELAREAEEEAERKRKAQLKADVEAKYAYMKQTGQFAPKPVGNFAYGARTSEEDSETPRDSGIEVDGLNSSLEKKRVVSGISDATPSYVETLGLSEAEIPESSSKLLAKGFKSRLHLKKPSLQNIKNELKRVRSDFNLAGNRDPSSSLSPVKIDLENSALKKSSSRVDLKKTIRLSKKISDLEGKLQQARKELDDALEEASPVAKLSSKHERFVPSATLKRPKFVPGKLPSLPSERILMAEQIGMGVSDERPAQTDEAEPRKGFDMGFKEFLAQDEEKENQSETRGEGGDQGNDETVKARAPRSYPARASSLFNLNNTNIEEEASSEDKQHDNESQSSEEIENMDPSSITNVTSESTPAPVTTDGYASLDAKLKALDENIKTARNASRPKKRKSKATVSDKAFKPGKESDDDAEWEEATPKKKRKSTGSKSDSSPPSKRSRAKGVAMQSSPLDPGVNGLNSPPNGKKAGDQAAAAPETSDDDDDAEHEEYSADELTEDQEQPHTSIDSPNVALEPVYEEEEETFTVPVKDAPSKPTAKATPARYGRNTRRPRSTSPNKRTSVQAGVEEQMMTKAAAAAQNHPGRQRTRSASPPPPMGYKKTTAVEETVSVVPGKDGVPKLPRGANGSFESLDLFETQDGEVEVIRNGVTNSDFQWPDDVF